MKAIYIVLIIIIPAALYLLFSKFKMKGNYDVLPEAYAGYQSVDSVQSIQSGNVIMQLLFESQEQIQSFLAEDSNVIIYTVHGKTGNSFYKIASSGAIADSLMIDSKATDLAFVKGFIIDKKKNEYYNWTFTGNKAAIGIPAENAGLTWDAGRQQSRLAYIRNLPGPVYVDYRFESPSPQQAPAGEIQTTQAVTNFAVLIYFNGNDWSQFNTTLNISQHFPWSYTEQLLWNNLFKRIDKRAPHDRAIIPSAAVRYRYFHKLPMEKVRFSGGGGNAAGFTEELYPGYLFSDIAFQEDTIRIKQHMYLNVKSRGSVIEIDGNRPGVFYGNKVQPIEQIDGYMYYTNPALQYALFADSDKRIYRIRKL
ncbi:hypothetical protein [uncultured Chitinophaga sp.]|jgi:hypothetical protein|uniref:hypothetical protein n=1 Tax=uncultured Chitinophaga sp. TaxID=339340 RepID=UPI0026098AC0|nr:hypothetical protein [uncultured Chitinophaga sp.]